MADSPVVGDFGRRAEKLKLLRTGESGVGRTAEGWPRSLNRPPSNSGSRFVEPEAAWRPNLGKGLLEALVLKGRRRKRSGGQLKVAENITEAPPNPMSPSSPLSVSTSPAPP